MTPLVDFITLVELDLALSGDKSDSNGVNQDLNWVKPDSSGIRPAFTVIRTSI